MLHSNKKTALEATFFLCGFYYDMINIVDIGLIIFDFFLDKVLFFVQIVNSGIQPLQNGSKYLEEDKRTEFVRGFITRGFTAFEKILQETSGIYCMGDEVTAADVFLVPQVSEKFKQQS